MRYLRFVILLLFFISCGKKENVNNDISRELIASIETITLLGDTLRSPQLKPGEALVNYEVAKTQSQNNLSNPDSLIWYGRRTAYLGYFQKAIEIFTTGIQKHPEDARFYRHRGHRFISTRQYDKAVEDFEKAVSLIEGKEDQIETDGLPNARNIPLSTLHGNVWYHLGLAYYLKNDMENALKAYSNRVVTQRYDDNIVSGGHWLYMINRRLDKENEANSIVNEVTKDMDIIENMAYHKMCLYYNGTLTEEDIKLTDTNEEDSHMDDVTLYSLGNWYLYDKQDTTGAKFYYDKLLKEGNKYSFAYLAGEADWTRIMR